MPVVRPLFYSLGRPHVELLEANRQVIDAGGGVKKKGLQN